MAGIAGLEGLSWTHEAWDTLDRCGAGQRRGQPGIQWEGIGYLTHASVNRWRTIEGQHGGVMKLHGTSVHFFLPTPFSSAVLKPDLEKTKLFTTVHICSLITQNQWEAVIYCLELFTHYKFSNFASPHFDVSCHLIEISACFFGYFIAISAYVFKVLLWKMLKV